MEIKVEFKLNLQNLKQYNYLKFRDKKRKTFSVIIRYFTIIVFLSTFVGYLFYNLNYSLPSIFALLVISDLCLPWLSIFGIKSSFMANPFLQEKREMNINEDGINIESVSMKIKIEYNQIHRIIEGKDIIGILLNENQGFILPKTALSEKEILSLFNILQNKVVQKKLIQRKK
ncbi:MAG: YcxB family protein [Spirochaetales bacterium]|nr:YcxB family protein [Spirochaetales bacterium]